MLALQNLPPPLRPAIRPVPDVPATDCGPIADTLTFRVARDTLPAGLPVGVDSATSLTS
jgi:hypothetical protein